MRIFSGNKKANRQKANLPAAIGQEDPVTLLPVDELGKQIQAAARKLLETKGSGGIRRNAWYDETQHPFFEGLCARMCEAYVFLAKDDRTFRFARDPGPEPRRCSHSKERGDAHYWMQSVDGVMDLNFGPDDQPDAGYVDYRAGGPVTRVQGFRPWKEDPRYPSNRDARKIVDAVWAAVGRETSAA